jgi:hypothetical protein
MYPTLPMDYNITSESAPACLYNPTYMETVNDVVLFILFVPFMLFYVLFGIVGNSLSIVVLNREMKGSTSFLLRALAISDNLVLVTYGITYSIPAIYTYTGYLEMYYEFYQLSRAYLWAGNWYSKTVST